MMGRSGGLWGREKISSSGFPLLIEPVCKYILYCLTCLLTTLPSGRLPRNIRMAKFMIFQYAQTVGRYVGEKSLSDFLRQIEIEELPQIPNDDTSTILSSKKFGLELTFSDEEFIADRPHDYPEGAIVLIGILFHGMRNEEHEVSPLQLPHTVTFSMTLDEILKKLGKPNFSDVDIGLYRWNFIDHSFFVELDESGKIFSISLQIAIKW